MAAKFPSPLPIRITLEVRKVFTNFFMLYLCRVEYDFCVFARKKFVKSLGGRELASHLNSGFLDNKRWPPNFRHHFRGKKSCEIEEVSIITHFSF